MKKKFNLLTISVTTITGGGTEYIYALARELKQDNLFNNMIVAPNDGETYIEKFKSDGITYYSSEIRKISLKTIFKLIKLCKSQKINLIHSNGKGAGLYSRLINIILGIPVIHSHHGFHIYNLPFLYRQIYKLSEIVLSRFTAKYIFVSKSEESNFSKFINVPKSKKIVIYNSINPKRLSIKKLTRKDLKFKKNEIIVISISRISPEKGLETIINSIPKLLKFNSKNNFKFIIIGDQINTLNEKNRYKNQLIKLINKFHLESIVEIWPENENIIDILNLSDIFISTSKGEGFSLALLEAMFMGKPIIATNVSGNKDALIDGYTGLLIPFDNSYKLASSIDKFLKEPLIAKKMGCEAKKYAEDNFSFDKMISNTKKIYLEVLN